MLLARTAARLSPRPQLLALRRCATPGPATSRRAAASAAAAAGARALLAGTSVLIISPVWPEWRSSAAGVRTAALVRAFTAWGWRVTYASTSDADNPFAAELSAAGVTPVQLPSNKETALATLLHESAPDVVLFDRFTSEEMFSFRVRELRPSALRVLDTQDLHSLRRARAAALQRGATPVQLCALRPDASDADTLRELSAIARSDLALICSPHEHRLLTQHYGVPAAKLALASFFVPPSACGAERAAALPAFGERAHVCWIGGFRHAPNADAAAVLAGPLWAALAPLLPRGSECHLYGAYPTGAAQQLHAPKRGVHMRGYVPSIDVLSSYRLLVAPIRYGAGIKGKLLDAWQFGTPVITTPLGAEGCLRRTDAPWRCDYAPDGDWAGLAGSDGEDEAWGGHCAADDVAGMAAAAAALYGDEAAWTTAQAAGFGLLRDLFAEAPALAALRAALERCATGRDAARAADFTGGMLWYHGARSTEYFARFIEYKERCAALEALAVARQT